MIVNNAWYVFLIIAKDKYNRWINNIHFYLKVCTLTDKIICIIFILIQLLSNNLIN